MEGKEQTDKGQDRGCVSVSEVRRRERACCFNGLSSSALSSPGRELCLFLSAAPLGESYTTGVVFWNTLLLPC